MYTILCLYAFASLCDGPCGQLAPFIENAQKAIEADPNKPTKEQKPITDLVRAGIALCSSQACTKDGGERGKISLTSKGSFLEKIPVGDVAGHLNSWILPSGLYWRTKTFILVCGSFVTGATGLALYLHYWRKWEWSDLFL